MGLFSNIFGDESSDFLKKAQKVVKAVAELEPEIKALSDADFPLETEKLKERLQKGETIEALLPRAFALVREAAVRTIGLRHYDVQIIGGLALKEGAIAEMRTGEGKTLVATLAAYANALAGKGVHVVTVNDYLARRDAVWMGSVYAFLGLSVGVINGERKSFLYDMTHTKKTKEEESIEQYVIQYEFLKPTSRRLAYRADITYGTNSEFGFDYLRDNLVFKTEELSQRGHAYAIVDEIDSILIDEARTPLIISSEAADSGDLYTTFARIASRLVKDKDFTVDEKHRSISLKDSGIQIAESELGVENIYTEKGIKYVHHLENAVRAQALFLKDREYVVKDDEIVIVDTFTGRLQPGRRWSEGLHQAIEAKEGVKIKKETRAVASITYQNYFRMYERLAGMTGTAKTSSEEFFKVYGLSVYTIPTNKPATRKDHDDFVYQTEKGKWQAVAHKVKELQEKGQPVLVGTVSIEKNELLSAYLRSEGVEHTVLNAKNHEREGELIAQAGRKGAVTVATNMAGRGIDILLGGAQATKEEQEAVRSAGGLFVIGTERHEARRIDNQLRGRAGRQGDPGETQFYLSLEDDLMRIFGGEKMKGMMGSFNMPEDVPIQNSFITRAIEGAQTKIEGLHFDSRKNTLEYDDVMNHQRRIVYDRRLKMVLADMPAVEEYYRQFVEGDEELNKELEKKASEAGLPAILETFRRIVLHVTDMLWVEHIETMDYLRSSVNLRAYGQRDPIVEYKREGLRLFRTMEESFRNEVRGMLLALDTKQVAGVAMVNDTEKTAIAADLSQNTEAVTTIPDIGEDKVGRNDPCPCGSGKKYKKCHGK